MKRNKKENQVWLNKAFDDLRWTESNLREKVYYGACFTAQQAVEKALKAYLLFKQGRFDKIHDLVQLIDQCKSYDKNFGIYREKVAKLSFYYVQTRYPDISDVNMFTKEEADEAHQVAQELLHFVITKVRKQKKSKTKR